ncbi:glycosyl transferase [Acrocarpospora phusangensis]|uniref:Glycosyl transferase n=1 Tax=Acrocarpospora phusangensis TaxID=1070424 RepID=A0A919UIX5_9ACTN|nr:nucleotide disphospho-sugar-binding domain-containing protein [Acrocarpospora phusangensis]GIH23524.1 glycosyl transferase [Acrocarpospora phusangensis]
MTRFLFYLSPQTGHLFPHVPAWQELISRGHEVSVRCQPQHIPLLAELGIAAETVAPAIIAREQDDWKARSPLEAFERSMRTFLDRAKLEIDDLRRSLEETSPDVVVVDGLCWGAGAAAEASSLPWAWTATYPLAVESKDLPPPGLGLTPRTDLIGALRDAAVGAVTRRFYRPFLAELNELRTRLGVSTVADLTEMWTTRAPLTMIWVAEPLEYPRSDWPPTVSLVGPGVWSPPAPEPGWLAAIDVPLILVSCSTERQADGRLATTALGALADRDVFVVITASAADIELGPLPRNARVERFVPHGPLIRRAACVICPGGMGTVHAALLAGVPLCVVPFGRDQPEVARRVERAGVGVRLPAGRLNAKRLRRAVDNALEMRRRAADVGRQLAHASNPANAADALETLKPILDSHT